MVFIDYVIFIISIFIILISALQSSNEDVMDAFTEWKQELFKNRKIKRAELVLNWSMFGLGLALIVFVIISNVDRFWNI